MGLVSAYNGAQFESEDSRSGSALARLPSFCVLIFFVSNNGRCPVPAHKANALHKTAPTRDGREQRWFTDMVLHTGFFAKSQFMPHVSYTQRQSLISLKFSEQYSLHDKKYSEKKYFSDLLSSFGMQGTSDCWV